ncbi:P-loop NTPase [Pyrolobus fumarii]|uniref:P-loop NTPase n=1 Tax=Pyrolobus fumarii TaxID=54252 RepID=UPI0014333142|nr:P-loop NTPase [Pyrolobus fumarii]
MSNVETLSIDPRLAGARLMLSKVKRIVLVMGSKGGVGKTLIATLLALQAARLGLRVGLLDLDVTGPSAHVVLGVDPRGVQPEEREGVVPPEVARGLRFMSIVFYTWGRPTPLRGESVDEVIKEVLAVTNWGELDLLVVDTPPGLRDETLDVLEYLPNPHVVAVTTPSKLAQAGVERLLALLAEQRVPRYLVENMARNGGVAKQLAERYGAEYLGVVGYDPSVEDAIGSIEKLLATRVARDVERVTRSLLGKLGLA